MTIKVHISDFQSIEKVDFEIDRFTALTGPSNAGKSAICRAIEGALFNRRGDDFVRKGKSSSKVILEFEDHTIEWVKGSKDNYYIVDGEHYDKVGGDAPDILKSFGFVDIEVGRKNIRPQMGTDQFSVLFLLRESGATIADIFSILGKLDIISLAGKDCLVDLREVKSLVKTRQDDLVKVNKQVSRYDSFDDIFNEGNSLTLDLNIIEKCNNDLVSLNTLLNNRKYLNKDINYLISVSDVKIPEEIDQNLIALVSKLESILENRNTNIKTIGILSDISKIKIPEDFSEDSLKSVKLINQILKQRSNLLLYNKFYNKLTKVLIPDEPNTQEFSIVEKMSKNRNECLESIDRISKEILSIENKIEDIHDELDSLLGDLDTCPVCDQEIKKKVVV